MKRGLGNRAIAGALPAALVLFSARNASSHLELTTPPPRLAGSETISELKNGPCGQAENGRTETVTVFQAGETITVEWEEYFDHPSYYRIAFDLEGDDDFPVRADMDAVNPETDDPEAANPVGGVVLAYVYEPDTAMETYSAQVTLPEMECETCTLQVIQFMYDKVGDGNDNEYYYQCADIALRGTSAGTGGSSGTGGSAAVGGSNAGGSGATNTGGAASIGGNNAVGGTSGGTTAIGGAAFGGSGGTSHAGGTASDGGTSSGGRDLTGGSSTTDGSGASGSATGGVGASSGSPRGSAGGCTVGRQPATGAMSGLLALATLGFWRRRRRLSPCLP